jgi:hypothetical protein
VLRLERLDVWKNCFVGFVILMRFICFTTRCARGTEDTEGFGFFIERETSVECFLAASFIGSQHGRRRSMKTALPAVLYSCDSQI